MAYLTSSRIPGRLPLCEVLEDLVGRLVVVHVSWAGADVSQSDTGGDGVSFGILQVFAQYGQVFAQILAQFNDTPFGAVDSVYQEACGIGLQCLVGIRLMKLELQNPVSQSVQGAF